jgi:hypothetical protein
MTHSSPSLQSWLEGGSCSRRLFLLSAMAGVVAVVGCSERQPNAQGSAASASPAWLAGTVGDTEAAARLGRIYLDRYPLEQNLDSLLSRIDAAVAPELVSGPTDIDQVLSALQRAVRGDYIHDRVVSVQGWLLSRTEAHVYAALALVAQP